MFALDYPLGFPFRNDLINYQRDLEREKKRERKKKELENARV